MWGALAATVLATAAAPPVVALLPLHPLGAPPDVVHALEVTLRNELAQVGEARLLTEKEVLSALQREHGCEVRLSCAAAAALHAGARQIVSGTTSQLGDAYTVDLKLLDARSLQEIRRATLTVPGSQSALVESMHEAAVLLIAPSRFTGSLRVEVPGAVGAALFVDGKSAGTLPLPQPLEGLAPGQHVVRVTDKGRETSTFVEVRFGRTTEATIDLAAPVVAVPAAALPVAVAIEAPQKQAWVRPAAIASLGAGVASAVVGVAFSARAASAPTSAGGAQLQSAAADASRDTNLARGFYIAAAVLAVAGGGLLWWDVHTDSAGLQTRF
jgi:hypothetical protein